jgi:hypothetical protein
MNIERRSSPSLLMTNGPRSASPIQRSPTCSTRKLRRSFEGPRTGRAEAPACCSNRWTLAFESSPVFTTRARSSILMMRRIERRGFSRFAFRIRLCTSTAIERLLPSSDRAAGFSASKPPRRNA